MVKRIAAGMNANKQYEQDQRQKEMDRHKDKGMLGLAVEIGQQIVSLHDAITMADDAVGLPVTDVRSCPFLLIPCLCSSVRFSLTPSCCCRFSQSLRRFYETSTSFRR